MRAIVVLAGQALRAAAATETRLQHDPLAGGQAGLAGIGDLTGDVRAGNMRQRNLHAIEAAPLPEIEMIQRARAHADDDPAGRSDRIGRVLVVQDLWSAMLMKSDCLHGPRNYRSLTFLPVRTQSSSGDGPAEPIGQRRAVLIEIRHHDERGIVWPQERLRRAGDVRGRELQ